MNDSKYGRLYPEQAVERARRTLEIIREEGAIAPIKVEEALSALDDLGFPPDEPLFLLRGQDELAPDTVRFYAQLVDHRLAGHGAPEAGLDMDHIEVIADRMERWEPRKLPD